MNEQKPATRRISADATKAYLNPPKNETYWEEFRAPSPRNISYDTYLGTVKDATEIVITKLSRVPIFARVLCKPEVDPKDFVCAAAITALLFDGQNIEPPTPAMSDPAIT